MAIPFSSSEHVRRNLKDAKDAKFCSCASVGILGILTRSVPLCRSEMHFSDLVAFLADHLIRVQLLPDGDVAFVGDVSKLTPDVKKSLIANKRKFVDLLSTEASTATAIADKLIEPFTEDIQAGYRDAWGLLTESLQVRAAIALDQIHRNGLSIDRSQVEATKQKLSTEVDRLVDLIGKLPEAEGVFKQKNGKFQLTASGKPSTNRSRLIEILEAVAFDLDLTPPRTAKTDTVRTSIKYWNQHADHCPFLRLWGQLEEVGKLCQFFAGLGTAEKIHPRYTVTVRTGRTSCRSPNVQQLPRSGGFREMVVPSPEHYFIAIDYSAIELRTLAAVCQRRYGESQLAETIKQGIDPHAFTAAMFEGETLEAFDNNPDKKTLRQRAKALNFGIPGGLGAKSLVAYASATYGVKMSVDEASAFRDKLIGEVYPELTEYLGDDAIDTLAINLKTSPMRVETAFDSAGVLGAAKRIVAGKGKANGDDYSEGFVNRIWETLKALNKNRKLRPSINARDAGDRLSRDLFFGPVVTLTGRLRGSVGFSQSRNTPFQGLAADGAKLALWRLYREGYRSVAFIHDEVLIEIPKDADFTAEAESIDRILCESMETLTGDIPIECEFSLANRWFKQAEAVFENGRLTPWEPNC